MDLTEIDQSNLIRDSYLINGISAGECRSIFLDWALKLRPQFEQRKAIEFLIGIYVDKAPDHPMSTVLKEASQPAKPAVRRGGSAGRHSG